MLDSNLYRLIDFSDRIFFVFLRYVAANENVIGPILECTATVFFHFMGRTYLSLRVGTRDTLEINSTSPTLLFNDECLKK
jgi:hypothetical protein